MCFDIHHSSGISLQKILAHRNNLLSANNYTRPATSVIN
uniref:Uncharacterized protein n=1 Tax=Arundo donax TaxID=35708 RepID=A0A0A9EVC6_ARUDO